jgi:hypothetical protein
MGMDARERAANARRRGRRRHGGEAEHGPTSDLFASQKEAKAGRNGMNRSADQDRAYARTGAASGMPMFAGGVPNAAPSVAPDTRCDEHEFWQRRRVRYECRRRAEAARREEVEHGRRERERRV